ncbi:hypothetical protein BBD42_01785 [Paenibacillus sp. BIHB 4019]|uniref:Uncharacterized protein n=1 Tax=Paenibacillus sp. BIHB 4019 TaxID=1870819 RepID=A0A1B2DCB5_9BACL|nr:hypothetical protein [Paenibacillus sp. BIHB 4019]ANY65346.1 hypothetical protein BBD42_01785 [Paenibacillus sp. BIHB 4019]
MINADVIIITHARYKILCSDIANRSLLTEGRHTLIIDERIDFPKYSFSKKTYKDMMNIFPVSLHGDLVNVCRPLFNEMDNILSLTDENGKKLYNKKIMKAAPKFRKKQEYLLDKFFSVVGNNLHQISVEHGEKGYNEAKSFMDTLEVLYADKCFFNNGTLKFVLNKQSKIIDHSNSVIAHLQFNSSAKKIEDNEEQYFKEIIELIKKNYRNKQRSSLISCDYFICFHH